MARSKARKTLVIEVPEIAPETDVAVKEEQEQGAEEEAQAASALPSRSEAYIYRLDTRTARFAFLDKLPLSEITTEILRDEYGGGKYEVVFRRAINGKMRATGKRQMQVDLSIPPRAPSSVRQELAAQAVQNGNGAAPVQQGTPDIIAAGILQLFESQRQNQTMQMQLFERALQPKDPVPWKDILGTLTGVVATLTPLLTNRRDPIEAARQIAELAQRNTGAASGVRDLLGGVREILEIRALVGDQPPEDPMIRLAEKLGPPVLEILAQGRAQQHAEAARLVARNPNLPVAPPIAAPVASARVGGSPDAPTGTVQPTSDGGVSTQPLWRIAVMREMPSLLRAAAADKDPALYGAFIAENLPEQFKGQTRQIAAHPEFVPVTLAQFPEMQQFAEWFTECLQAFRDHILGVESEGAGDAIADPSNGG